MSEKTKSSKATPFLILAILLSIGFVFVIYLHLKALKIGWAVLMFVWTPLLVLVLASLLDRPRKTEITTLFLVLLIALSLGFIFITYLTGAIAGLFL